MVNLKQVTYIASLLLLAIVSDAITLDLDTKELHEEDMDQNLFEGDIEADDREADAEFHSLGCWKDKRNRAIKKYFGYLSVEACFEKAKSLNYTVFALQSKGQCFTSANAEKTYKKYGGSKGCKKDGKGGQWANEVYKIGPAAAGKTCTDGALALEEDGTPKMYWNGKWSPICGHWFWDNHLGARTFCKKLGFSTGKYERLNKPYSDDALLVGRCRKGEPLTKCTGKCNNKYVGNGRCGKCKRGEKVAIKITCAGLAPTCG